jgi:hypothetical protein
MSLSQRGVVSCVDMTCIGIVCGDTTCGVVTQHTCGVMTQHTCHVVTQQLAMIVFLVFPKSCRTRVVPDIFPTTNQS